jgi:hypothetical protein
MVEIILYATCGQLKLPECFYYVLHWVFDSEGYAGLDTPEVLDIQVSLRQSAYDQEIDIPQRSYTTSQGTPSVHENSASAARIQTAVQWWKQYCMPRADNSNYPSASTMFSTGSLISKAMPGSIHLRNWIFRSLSGKAPTTRKSISHSVHTLHLKVHLASARTQLALLPSI